MKILIVSDNHGDLYSLEELIKIYGNSMDLYLHCGDSEFTATDKIWNTFKTVAGNMDFDPEFPSIRIEKLKKQTFLIVHGHRHNVGMTHKLLEGEALKKDAGIVFYGHTHIPKVDKLGEIYFINPGSIAQPRGNITKGSYAIYTENKNERKIEYYDWNHNKIEELSQILD